MRTLFILRGAPASGKSTWIKENDLEPHTLSTDNLRLMYQSPVTNDDGTVSISQNNDTAVWKLLMELLERRMEQGEFIIIDATHYKSSLISKYKDLVCKYRYRVYVVDFSNITEEELIKRNAQRGFRTVPEDVIKKMIVALKDDSEVKKSYKIITPEEAAKMTVSALEPFDANQYERVVIFGDIHGCYDPLKEYFDKNPFNEKYNYIFCGDYLDRGLQNKEVLEFLIELKEKPNCVFLEGNHEKWLRIYSQKDYDMDNYETSYDYRDPFVTKVIAQLKDKQNELQKKINKNKTMSEEISKLLRESWETNPDNREVYYQFELINVPDTQKELHAQNTKMQQNLEKLTRLICVLQHEEHNTKDYIKSCKEWFDETFEQELSLNIGNILEKSYNVTQNKKDNPIKSLEFIKRTYPQIKDIDKVQIRRFCDKLAQMSYFTFCGHDYLVTHGGVPCMPTIKTPTMEMIKGVGKYEDHDKIDKMFNENEEKNKTWTVQIHGHRNVMRVPVVSNDNMTFNLEGQVEFGGHLRVLELGKPEEFSVFEDGHWRVMEIKNNNFQQEEIQVKEEKTDLQILKDLTTSKLIQVKNLDNNIISLNFTRDAFYDKKWNDLTCTARGLFVNKTNGDIVCRSFSKFFNHKERPETETAGLKQKFVFPVIGYKKENGFLATISKYNGEVKFFTKSTDQGDYVNWFIGVLCDHYGIKHLGTRYTDIYNQILFLNTQENCDTSTKTSYLEAQSQMIQELKNKLNPLLDEGYSYVFECIDKDNDPHIIKYKENNVYLLQVFKNQLKEEHVSWRELNEISNKLIVPCKSQELRFENWEQFEQWKDEFTKGITQWKCKHEGYVFEDANGFQVKFKSSFYKFWKQMRAIKEALQGGRLNKKIYKTKEEIQVVKILESYTREELKAMSIIDIQDKFYEQYED